tara:strand:- start:2923 stop:4008 length:1086 start_codon:yes stop_codon:yes gene_type:complete
MKKNKVIYILGTKAQFIKCKNILLNLIAKDVEILVVDTGQHRELTKKELDKSGLIYEYIELSKNKNNISTIPQMIKWFFKILFSSKKYLSVDQISYAMIHGDTVSTLIGLIFCKINKVKTIHLESGYKSNNIFKPFPEEIIRNIVSRFSNMLIVDGPKQYENVKKFNNKKEIIQISRNTIYDSVSDYIRIDESISSSTLTVTVHRTENVYSKKQLKLLIQLLYNIKNNYNFELVQWFCHDVTYNSLLKNNMLQEIESKGIVLMELIPHDEFIKKLIESKLIITDGGSISEECSVLGLNTIIWRDVVENINYLNENVILSDYDFEKIYKFIDNLPTRKSKSDIERSPSEELVNLLIPYIQSQ